MNSKDIVICYISKFKEVYGIEYPVSFKRDTALVNRYLKGKYEDEILVAIIDYFIKNYKHRWYNPKYPTPTLGALCTWCHPNCYLAVNDNGISTKFDNKEQKETNNNTECRNMQYKTLW